MPGSHGLVDKSMQGEAALLGFGSPTGPRPFAEPGVLPRYGPSHPFLLPHIHLSLTLDPATPGLQAEAILEIRPRPAGLGEVRLNLDDAMEVSSVTLLPPTDEGADDGEVLVVWRHRDGGLWLEGLPAEGGRVRVCYGGVPERGLYFTGPNPAHPGRRPMCWTQCQDEDAHHFLPCVDHPSQRSRFTLRILAPTGLTVVSNGTLAWMGRAEEGWSEWIWQQHDPIPVYLLTMVVGHLGVLEAEDSPVPTRYLAPLGTDEATLRRSFGRTPEMIRFFGARFGTPYPWARYDQVVVDDFIFGGMENAGSTTLVDVALLDERAVLDVEQEDLIAHELAHQWFGDLVTCQDWSQGWLNEGWATYAESLWRRHDRGDASADLWLHRQMHGYFQEDRERYRRALIDYRFRSPIDMFDRHLYEKGALVLHTLQQQLGGEPFWAGVQLYLERHALQAVHTRHFQRALEDATGENLDGFFKQWVRGAGHPELTVVLSHAEGALSVTVRQGQSGEGVASAFRLALPLQVVEGGQAREVVLRVAERERTWTLSCPLPPDHVAVNPCLSVLCELKVEGPIGWMLHQLRHSPHPIARIRAAEALARDGARKAREGLRAALRREALPGVRAEIARLLGERGESADRDALIAALADPDPRARRAITDALAPLRHPAAAAAVRERLEAGEPGLLAEGALLSALGRQRADDAVEILAAHLGRPSWGDVLTNRALEGLGHSQDPAALELLLDWTGDDHPARCRAAAAAALGRLADAVDGVRRAAVDRLLALSHDAPFRVRLAAIGALALAGDDRALPRLRRIHTSARDGRLRRAAYEAAEQLSAGRTSEAGLATLRAELENLREENRRVRARLDRLESR